ncbi:MAG: hypothetical protein C0610_16665 [Desulfobacteraceae bacterium]|nr:MAG: hypothetical protein C0610_16665 [Desulfobacteraceae bacterium]
MAEELLFEKLGGDGAHCGLTDLYPNYTEALMKAIKTHGDFDTGWYASKKEIASGRIVRRDGLYIVSASVSDDFDTEGLGVVQFKFPSHVNVIEEINKRLNEAWDLADEDRKENAVYAGYSIGKAADTDEVKRFNWIWSYIQPVGIGVEFYEPPGDCYHSWGWEYGGINKEDDKLTTEEREGMEEWIENGGGEPAKFGRWVIESWEG